MDYIIAEHRIRICGSNEWLNTIKSLEGFIPFQAAEEGTPIAILTDSQDVPPTLEEVLYSSDTEQVSNRFGRTATGYLFESTHIDGNKLTVWTNANEPTTYFQGDMNLQLVRFAIWIAYGIKTIPHQTIAIHTSCIVQQGKAVIFLGESGTGKSTHTRLWREHIEGAFLLNDDSPIVRIINGVPTVFGSPWSGKTPCYKQEHYPLAACVRLSQAPYNKITRLKLVQAYAALHPSCPPDFAYDDQLYDHISATLGDILAEVPVYHLACLPDREAALLSHKTVMQ